MKETPLLFQGDMVRAILDGSKTQTRRVVKPQPVYVPESNIGWITVEASLIQPEGPQIQKFPGRPPPYGPNIFLSIFQPWSVGSKIWVKETFCLGNGLAIKLPGQRALATGSPAPQFIYRADNLFELPVGTKWKPSIFMPRSASRITLEITEVRVQRVQEISEEDAIAEGIPTGGHGKSSSLCPAERAAAIMDYQWLWDSINAKRGYPWSANPWVWAITFKRI